jgi:hypothetical protein
VKRRTALAAAACCAAWPAAAVPAQPGGRVAWPEVAQLDGGRFGPALAAALTERRVTSSSAEGQA